MTESTPVHARLAVLGSPIAHSLSPLLHRAAYARLGLAWTYDRVEMTGDRLPEFVTSLDASWRGLSLTMPLKRDILPLVADLDPVARCTQAVNTVLFRSADDPGSTRFLSGYNTDVAGIVRALNESGITSAPRVTILGGGATAASALVAAAELGAEFVRIAARTPVRAEWLRELARDSGVVGEIVPLDQVDSGAHTPDLVLSTLPASAADHLVFRAETRQRATLLDVAYDPWPSALATTWSAVGGTVVSGLAMLIHQALIQVRIFVTGDPHAALPEEPLIVDDMRAAASDPERPQRDLPTL